MKIILMSVMLFFYNQLSFCCEENEYDKCKNNEECCSGDCEKTEEQEYGLCKSANQCEPLISKKLHITCYADDDRPLQCDKPLPHNSSATFSCDISRYMYIADSDYNKIHCRNGQWDQPLIDDFCVSAIPDCGQIPFSNDLPIILNSEVLRVGQFPWYAGIYEYNGQDSSYEQVCGGTLISNKVVVSAASCVSIEDKKSKKIVLKDYSIFRIALGKYFKSLTAPEDSFAQFVSVNVIEVSLEYKGSWNSYASDIAVLILKTKVLHTIAVRPICIDLRPDRYELEVNAIGKFANWGLFTNKIEELDVTNMPYVQKQDCVNKISTTLSRLVTPDKMCAGDRSSVLNDCKSNSGGGLVFLQPETRAYYLHGIASFTPKVCDGKEYLLFTKLSFHRDLIKKYLLLDDYSGKEKCEALWSEKLQILCYAPNGLQMSCYQPLPSGSIAVFACNPSNYVQIKKSKYDSIKCRDGKWDKELLDDFCSAECGKSAINSDQPTNVLSKQREYEFPWHCLMYQYNENSDMYDQICSGTLISSNVVITAAQCVVIEDTKFQRPRLTISSSLRVAFGKYYRVFDSSKDNFAQIAEVERIQISADYSGRHTGYANDIAFITLKKEITFTEAVQPICIDVNSESFEEDQLQEGALGKIAAWGSLTEQKATETLKKMEITFLSRSQCLNEIESTRLLNVGRDKMCGKDRSSGGVSVCRGDVGGGLVFEDPLTKAYYLRGVLSLTPPGCNREEHALFTNLSFHKSLVEKFLQSCERQLSYARKCGRAIFKPAISKARETISSEFPWHAGIYEYNSTTDSYNQIYGGTLISRQVVISAAHCFAIEDPILDSIKIKEYQNLKVVLGKYYKAFNAPEENSLQITGVGNIEIPLNYEGRKSYYADDIAVITLTPEINYTASVRPACVDIGKDSFEEEQLKKGATGQVAGWGITIKQDGNESLKVIDMPFVSRLECREVTLCEGDGGGGLFFLMPDSNSYYLRAVISLVTKECKGEDLVLFTKLSYHIELIEKYLVQDCKGICKQKCGEPVALGHEPLVASGITISYGEFPWHAGIYRLNENGCSFDQICGGTLISEKVVVSAAHCVTLKTTPNGTETRNSSDFRVALGKYYRNFDAPQDTLAQIFEVHTIEIPSDYRAHISLYDHDIAFITLKTLVKFNWAIRPVCVDVGINNFEEDQLKKGQIGKIVGWGFTEKQKPSEELILGDMPFVERRDCISKISSTLASYASMRDKICAGDKNSSMSVCKGDSGGGLVFENPKNKAYYLRGIVSLGPQGCKGKEFVLFTKLSSHKKLVHKYLYLP